MSAFHDHLPGFSVCGLSRRRYPLQHPERRRRSDRIGCDAGRPGRSGPRRRRAIAPSDSTAAMKASWPSSTPTLNAKSASGMSPCGSPISARAPAKPSPCRRPKEKATSHGKDRVRLALSLRQLIGQEDDAEGDRRLDRRRGHMDEAECRRSEGDRVGDGEGGDGGDQCPHAAHQQDQAQHEQEMVRPEQNVLDAEGAIGLEDVGRARVGVDDH